MPACVEARAYVGVPGACMGSARIANDGRQFNPDTSLGEMTADEYRGEVERAIEGQEPSNYGPNFSLEGAQRRMGGERATRGTAKRRKARQRNCLVLALMLF